MKRQKQTAIRDLFEGYETTADEIVVEFNRTYHPMQRIWWQGQPMLVTRILGTTDNGQLRLRVQRVMRKFDQEKTA